MNVKAFGCGFYGKSIELNLGPSLGQRGGENLGSQSHSMGFPIKMGNQNTSFWETLVFVFALAGHRGNKKTCSCPVTVSRCIEYNKPKVNFFP